MSFYLAKFFIDDDGDWNFNDYEGLNGKSYLFDEAEEALALARTHLKECMNSLSGASEELLADVFNNMQQLYFDENIWQLTPPDYNGNVLFIYCNFDNYLIKYTIDEVDFYDSIEVDDVEFGEEEDDWEDEIE